MLHRYKFYCLFYLLFINQTVQFKTMLNDISGRIPIHQLMIQHPFLYWGKRVNILDIGT